MGEAVDGDRFEAGVAEDDFVERLAGGVAVVGGLDVGGEPAAQLGNALEEQQRLGLAEGFVVVVVAVAVVGGAGFVAQGAADLRGEPVVQPVDELADVVADVAAVEAFAAAVAGVEDLFQLVGGGDDLVVVRQRAMAEVVDLADVVVGADDPLGELGELVFEAEVGRHGGNAPAVGHALGWSREIRETCSAKENGVRKKARRVGRMLGHSRRITRSITPTGTTRWGSGVRPDSYRCTSCWRAWRRKVSWP